jgi:hypothetical protein
MANKLDRSRLTEAERKELISDLLAKAVFKHDFYEVPFFKNPNPIGPNHDC